MVFRDFYNNYFSISLQANGNGPKRIPLPQQGQMKAVTPTPHQRVLGLSNGPQRIQRPVSHQKPVAHVSAVKSSNHPDQNVNPDTRKGTPALQPKHDTSQNQTKANMPKVNPEPAKQPSESARQEKPQSKPYTTFSKLTIVSA